MEKSVPSAEVLMAEGPALHSDGLMGVRADTRVSLWLVFTQCFRFSLCTKVLAKIVRLSKTMIHVAQTQAWTY